MPGGGEGGIRTRGAVAGTHDFQSCTFDHSVTSPRRRWRTTEDEPACCSGSKNRLTSTNRRRARQRSPEDASGGRGIRTHGTVTGTLDFESSAFDHSANPPSADHSRGRPLSKAIGPSASISADGPDAAKNSLNSAPHSSPRTPPTSSKRWLSRGPGRSCRASGRAGLRVDRAVDHSIDPPFTSAPAHIGQGSSVRRP